MKNPNNIFLNSKDEIGDLEIVFRIREPTHIEKQRVLFYFLNQGANNIDKPVVFMDCSNHGAKHIEKPQVFGNCNTLHKKHLLFDVFFSKKQEEDNIMSFCDVEPNTLKNLRCLTIFSEHTHTLGCLCLLVNKLKHYVYLLF